MGDRKAKDLPNQGRNLAGSGDDHKPGDKRRGAGLTARDGGSQTRNGKDAQGTGR